MRRIARMYTDFGENFGIPRQSGLAEALRGEIIFEKDFRNDHAVRGLEEFTHIWVLWKFDLPEAPAESGGGGGAGSSEMAGDRAAASSGRECADGGFRYSFAFSAQSHRSVLCETGLCAYR